MKMEVLVWLVTRNFACHFDGWDLLKAQECNGEKCIGCIKKATTINYVFPIKTARI